MSSKACVQREICPLYGCSLVLRDEEDNVRLLAAASRGHRTAVSQTTATRVLRASIRIVAGQASGEAVGCKLLDRSRLSILDYWPTILFDFTRSGRCLANDPILPVLRRFLAIRGTGPVAWLLHRSNRISRETLQIPFAASVVAPKNVDVILKLLEIKVVALFRSLH